MSEIVGQYEIRIDSKKRITLKESKCDYYSVTAYADGSVSLEPKYFTSQNDAAANEGYKAFQKLRENAKQNGTAGMTLGEINKIIYGN